MDNNGIYLTNRNLSLNTIIMVMVSILLIMLSILIRYSNTNARSVFMVLTIYGLITFMWIIFSWYIKTKNIFSVYTFFMLFSILFYFGQPIAFLLGADVKSFKVFPITIYSYSTLNETLLFIIISYLLIHIGGLISLISVFNTEKKRKVIDYSTSMNVVGNILFAISVLPTIILLVNSFKAVFNYGYIGLFIASNTIAVNGGAFGVAAGFFVPSLYMLIIANSKVVIKRNTYTFILLAYISIVFLLGRRGENTICLLGLVLIWHSCIKPISGKRVIKFFIWGIILLFFLSVISQIRVFLNTENISSLIVEKLSDKSIFQSIYDILAEFGLTLLVPTTIIEYAPDVIPYYKGKTIINFFMNLIPNFFWDVNPGLRDGTLESIVSPFISKRSIGGIGSSFLAEIYYNFGYFGYLILPLYGMVISKLSNNFNRKFGKVDDKLKLYFYVYLFNIVLWYIRGEIMTSGKRILYFAIFPVFLVRIIQMLYYKGFK